MSIEEQTLLVAQLTLATTLLTLILAAWKKVARAFRKFVLRRRLNKYFPEFEEKLLGKMFDHYMDYPFTNNRSEQHLEGIVRKGEISKIKEEFIEKLGPNEKEKEIFSTAIEMYEKSMRGKASLPDDLSETNTSPEREKEIDEEIGRQMEKDKTKLYDDILYWMDKRK